MKNNQLYGYLFLLPAILIVWASSQIYRSSNKSESESQTIIRIEQSIKDMEVLEKADPSQTIPFDGMDYEMTPGVAMSYFKKDLEAAKFQALQLTVKNYLAPFSLIAALTAILTATLTLLKVRAASRTSLQSRDHLLRSFSSTRHVLPLAATTVTVAIALSLAGLLSYESITIWNADLADRTRVKLTIICGLMAAASLWLVVKSLFALPSAWKLFKPDPQPLYGQNLAKAEASGLWQWIEELSHSLSTPPPDFIVVGLNESFFVTSVSYELKPSGLITKGKLLHLPLAEMSLLSRAETSAIIGHELGHFCGEDTAYSQRFIPIYAGVEQSLDAVLKVQKGGDGMDYLLRPAWLLGLWVMDKFHEAVMHWSRIREFAADQVGVKIAGSEAACSALVRVVAVGKPVSETYRTLRNAPEEIAGDFLKSLRKEAYRHGFSDPETFLDKTIAHPTDSHPPTRERITAMGASFPLAQPFLEQALRRDSPDEASWLEPMFSDLGRVTKTLTATLGDVIQQQETEVEKDLDAMVSATAQTHTFYEKTFLSIFILAILGLGIIGGGIATMLTTGTTTSPEKLKWIGIGMIVLGMIVTWASSLYVKRSKKPFLEITGQGFKIPGISDLIPWNDVVEVNFSQQKQILTTSIQLVPNTTAVISKDPLRRSKYKKKSSLLHLVGGKPKGMKVQAYVDLIVSYFHASQARELQKIRQDEKAAVKARFTE